jgi:intein/homing endonuclease
MRATALTQEQTERVQAWTAIALEHMPYFAATLFSLRYVNAPGLGTFAVDKHHRCYIDFDAVAGEGPDKGGQSLLHECAHLYGAHSDIADELGLTEGEQRKILNIACFPAGTLLPGNVPIESVASMVRHFDGELITVNSQAGTVQATPEHPFRVRHRRHKKGCHPIVLNEAEWMDAGDIREGDYVCTPRLTDKRADTSIDLSGFAVEHAVKGRRGVRISGRTVRSIPLNADTAWLIGLYTAEGSSSPTVRFSLASYEASYAERIERIADAIGYSASRFYSKVSRGCAVTLGTSVLGRWLKEAVGDGARNKHVPDVILRHSDPAIRAAFIEGLVDGDGYRGTKGKYPAWTVSTSSKSLMHDLLLLLAQDGIGGNVRTQAQRDRSIDGVELPPGMLYGVTWNPNGPSVSTRTLNGKRLSTYSHRWKADEDGVWYPVNEVTRRPFVGPVYNMSTPSHTYIVHGVLVHNCDASINDDLRDGGLTMFADGAGYVTPSTIGEPDYQTVQFYFRALQARVAQKQQSGQGQPQPGAGAGTGQPGQGQPGPGSGQPGTGQGGAQPSAGAPGPYKGCGSGSGGNAAPGELDADDDLGGAAPAATATEAERVRVTTAVAIREAAAKGRGTVPAGLVELADQILAPSKVPWQKVLGRRIRGSVRSRMGTMDVFFNRRSARRHNERIITPSGPGRRIVVPAAVDPTPRIAVVRDTSGSMSDDDLSAVTNEVVGIAKKLRVRGPDLTITDVDARAYAARKFTGAKDMAQVQGRGGTDMCVGIVAALDAKPKPTVVIVMTDGFTPWPTQETRIPVIAVIIGAHPAGPAANVPSWIRTVLVETS